MAHIAAKKLITSKGNVLSGEELPAGLPSDEVQAIGDAGGILDWQKSARAGGGKKSSKTAEKRAAEKAVADAEALLDSATDDAARATAQELLEEAKAELEKLG